MMRRGVSRDNPGIVLQVLMTLRRGWWSHPLLLREKLVATPKTKATYSS
jgi:hypothetical protein